MNAGPVNECSVVLQENHMLTAEVIDEQYSEVQIKSLLPRSEMDLRSDLS